MILQPFPTPPAAVLFALDQLDILRRGDLDEIRDAGDLTDLPRPWEPATCPAPLRAGVWQWCYDVALWINHEFAWRPVLMIPACWPRHPHIARELPVLAILRWTAEESLHPESVEEWHRYTLPMFGDRMAGRLGESTCRTGKHQEWPAQSRHAASTGSAAHADRQSVIRDDTGQMAVGELIAVPKTAGTRRY